MRVGSKLQVKPGMKVCLLDAPSALELELPEGTTTTTKAAAADAVVLFVTTRAELESRGRPVVEAARDDRLAWVAYPKARQLGTDLNRDLLAERLLAKGLQPVRQIAIDATWSALRFRPGR